MKYWNRETLSILYITTLVFLVIKDSIISGDIFMTLDLAFLSYLRILEDCVMTWYCPALTRLRSRLSLFS